MVKKITFLLFFFFFAIFFSRNILIEYFLESTLEKAFLVNVNISGVRSEPFSGNFQAEGITFENPKGFKRKLFLYMPRVNLIVDLMQWVKGKGLHFYLIDFEVETVNLIRDQAGKLNLTEILTASEKYSKQTQAISLEYLRFDIKDVFIYEEKSKHTKIRSYPLEMFDLTYANVDSLDDIIDELTVEAAKKIVPGEQLNVLVGPFFDNVKNVVKVPVKTVGSLKKTPKGIVKLLKRQK